MYTSSSIPFNPAVCGSYKAIIYTCPFSNIWWVETSSLRKYYKATLVSRWLYFLQDSKSCSTIHVIKNNFRAKVIKGNLISLFTAMNGILVLSSALIPKVLVILAPFIEQFIQRVYAPIFVEPGYSYGVLQERGYEGVSQNNIVIFAIKK